MSKPCCAHQVIVLCATAGQPGSSHRAYLAPKLPSWREPEERHGCVNSSSTPYTMPSRSRSRANLPGGTCLLELGCRGCQVVQARYYSVCWYSQHEWDRATVLRQSDILEPCIALSGHVPEAAQGLSRAEGGGDPSRWVMLETSPLTTPTCGGYAEFMPEESKLQTQHATTPWLAAGCDALLSNPWDPQHSRSELANSLPYRPSHVIRPRSSPWFLRGGQRIGHLGMGSFSGEVPRVSVQASPAPVSIPCIDRKSVV